MISLDLIIFAASHVGSQLIDQPYFALCLSNAEYSVAPQPEALAGWTVPFF